MMRRSALLFLSAAMLSTACRIDRNPPRQNAVSDSVARAMATRVSAANGAYLEVDGGRIWYRVLGAHAHGVPVILLHGGPGYSSFYLKPLEALAGEHPIVRYDQLGGGKSDALSDTSKFTIAHFVAELDSLRSALQYEKVALLGHSWGTILALEYYRAHPGHVSALVLASPALDIPAWEKHANELVKTLSDSSQRAIRKHEASKSYDSPEYQKANEEFFAKYVTRTPDAANLDSLMRTVNQDIYMHMQGPSEFTIVGTLKRYNATSFLPQIAVPTLFTVGQFDEADPDLVKKQAALVPNARYEVIPGAAHIVTWDNPEAFVSVVREFLGTVR